MLPEITGARDDGVPLVPLQEPLYAHQLCPEAVHAVLGGELFHGLEVELAILAPQLHEPLLGPPAVLRGYPVEDLPRLARQPPDQSPGHLAAPAGLEHSPLGPQEPLPRLRSSGLHHPSHGVRVLIWPAVGGPPLAVFLGGVPDRLSGIAPDG